MSEITKLQNEIIFNLELSPNTNKWHDAEISGVLLTDIEMIDDIRQFERIVAVEELIIDCEGHKLNYSQMSSENKTYILNQIENYFFGEVA